MSNFVMQETPLTVEQLISYLQDLVKKDPDMKSAIICHVEFGAITKSHTLYVTEEDDKPAVVISGND